MCAYTVFWIIITKEVDLYVHACVLDCRHICIHTVHAYIRVYIHTYMHARHAYGTIIHTRTYECVHACTICELQIIFSADCTRVSSVFDS